MGLITTIRRLVDKMFTKDIKSAYKVDTALTQAMSYKIEQWERMYKGKAPWVDNDGVISLRLEQAIVREFANIALNEMEIKVSNERLNGIFQRATRDLSIHLQKGLATGAFIIKPLGADKVQYLSQSAFIPIAYDVNGKLTKVIFPEVVQKGTHEYLIRLEYHSLEPNGLTITNRAFKSTTNDSLGREISLESVPEWAELMTTVTYPLMDRQAFGYFVTPIDNTIDGGNGGVSIFDNAVDLIKYTDIQFGRLEWEFASGERAIHVDEQALTQDGEVSKLNKRLYRGLNLDLDGNGGDLFAEYSPQIRQADYVAGLEEYKRAIEFNVGLSYGDISNPQSVEKTATEIKVAKKRKYNTVTAIQKNLQACLDDLCYALAFYNSLATSGYEFICKFKDSILIDDETERAQDMQDVAIGAMGLAEYRSKWYGEPLEVAKKNIAEGPTVIE